MFQKTFLKEIQSDQLRFALKEYDETDSSNLDEYCRQCAIEGVSNNSSMKKMKMGFWGVDKWWVVYELNVGKIVSASGCHPIFEYEPNCWRIMFRLATLKQYRAKAGPISKDQRNCFGWGVMLPFMVNHCRSQGAKKIIFTTNSGTDGDLNSLRQDRICRKVFEKLNMAKLIDNANIFHTRQNIWQVQIEDVYSKKALVL